MTGKKVVTSGYDPSLDPNYNPIIEGYSKYLNFKAPYQQ